MVKNPTHVVTIGVYDTHRQHTELRQLWCVAGPFDDPSTLLNLLQEDLWGWCDGQIEPVKVTQTFGGARMDPCWAQLSLLDDQNRPLPSD